MRSRSRSAPPVRRSAFSRRSFLRVALSWRQCAPDRHILRCGVAHGHVMGLRAREGLRSLMVPPRFCYAATQQPSNRTPRDRATPRPRNRDPPWAAVALLEHSGVRELAYRLLQLVDPVDDLLGDADDLLLHLLSGNRRIQQAEDRPGDEAAGEGEEEL